MTYEGDEYLGIEVIYESIEWSLGEKLEKTDIRNLLMKFGEKMIVFYWML